MTGISLGKWNHKKIGSSITWSFVNRRFRFNKVNTSIFNCNHPLVPSSVMFPSEHTMYTWQFSSRSNECNVIWFISKVKFGQQREKSKNMLTVILRSKAYSDTSLSDRYKQLSLVVIGIRCTVGTLLLDSIRTGFPRFVREVGTKTLGRIQRI